MGISTPKLDVVLFVERNKDILTDWKTQKTLIGIWQGLFAKCLG